ncbi:MAG: RimK family alpha-L-glutamate ligase [Acidimicrobiia bacterium]
MDRQIGILYEHPEWFKPLFAELDRRGVSYERIHAARHAFDPGQRFSPYSLLVNRMSPSAWLRGHGQAIFHTLEYLAYLEDIGVNVLNGHRAFSFEVSKARQLSLFAELGLRFPRAHVINHHSQVAAAAAGLRLPILVKPNVGGSGAGIRSFEDHRQLAEAAAGREPIQLGPDHSGLVQEYLPAEDEAIVRIEILGGEFLYAIRLRLLPGSFNLCPADYCELPGVADGVSGRGLPVEACDPPEDLVKDARRIIAAAGMDLGGVEYVVNTRDGEAYFYDVNALSNFVTDAPEVVGFDPFVNLVDFILERAEMGTGAPTG